MSLLCLHEMKQRTPEQLSDDTLDQILGQAITPFNNLVCSEILQQIREQVHAQVHAQVRNSSRPVRAQVKDQIWHQLKNRGREQDLEQLRNQLGKQVSKQIWGQVIYELSDQFWVPVVYSQQFRDQLSDLAMDALLDVNWSLFCGSGDADCAALYSFFTDIVWLDDPVSEPFRIYETLANTCGFVWFNENFLVISDRPEEIHRDAQGRLHNNAGPSISFRDGWCQFHWHGVAIPGEWVTGKPPSAAEALTWENMEQRRVACEMLGWKNILNELDVKVIDEAGDPEIGILLEVDIPDSGKERFLQVRCGTGREFVLPVPPHVKTALQANAWTWDIEDYEYMPEVRT